MSNLYAVGGAEIDTSGFMVMPPITLDAVLVLNGTSWSTAPSLATARNRFGLASHDGLLYAVGGYDGGTGDSTEVFNSTSGTWSEGPDLTNGRSRFGLASL